MARNWTKTNKPAEKRHFYILERHSALWIFEFFGAHWLELPHPRGTESIFLPPLSFCHYMCFVLQAILFSSCGFSIPFSIHLIGSAHIIKLGSSVRVFCAPMTLGSLHTTAVRPICVVFGAFYLGIFWTGRLLIFLILIFSHNFLFRGHDQGGAHVHDPLDTCPSGFIGSQIAFSPKQLSKLHKADRFHTSTVRNILQLHQMKAAFLQNKGWICRMGGGGVGRKRDWTFRPLWFVKTGKIAARGDFQWGHILPKFGVRQYHTDALPAT